MIPTKIYYSLIFLLILITSVTAYSYKIPVCNATSYNNSCLNVTSVGAITNAPNSMIYYQDGNIYLTNDTIPNIHAIYNYTMINVTNISYNNITMINFTNISYYNGTILNYTYNYSYGSSNTINKSEFDNIYANQSQLTNLINSLPTTYSTKTDLINLEARITNLNSISNLSSLNMTRINEHLDSGDFSGSWKIAIVIEGILIVLLILFAMRMSMSG